MSSGTINIKVTTMGNSPDRLVRNNGTKLGEVVTSRTGQTIFLNRNGARLEGVGPDTILADGDDILVVANKTVGSRS